MKRHVRYLCLCWILVLGCLIDVRAETPAWQAGAATINITPDNSLAMSGYGSRNEPAEGKLTDLWAKALVLDAGADQRAVLISLDLVGIDRSLSLAICQALLQKHGLQRSQIAICASHTHTGPVVGMNLAPLHYLIQPPEQQKMIDEYATLLRDKVVEVVGRALANRQTSQVSWGNGRCTFAVNRRENKPYENAGRWRTEGVLKGPVDHDVPVLAVHDEAGELIALLFGYACHATVLDLRQWSGDYPGYAQMELENLHPGCVAMFWAGCGADQNPLPRRSVALAQHYGRRLANAVDSVLLTTEMMPVAPVLQTLYSEIELPLAELPSREQIQADAAATDKYVQARATLLLKQLDREPLASTYPYPISAWKLGSDVQFVALGGEVVVDYAARLKVELSGVKTWVAGYAHDVMAYIPSRRVLREGGYEGGGAMVYYGLPTVWSEEVEDRIVGEVHRLLEIIDGAADRSATEKKNLTQDR